MVGDTDLNEASEHNDKETMCLCSLESLQDLASSTQVKQRVNERIETRTKSSLAR